MLDVQHNPPTSPLLFERLILLQFTVQLQHLGAPQERSPLCVVVTLVEELEHPGLPGVICQQVDKETGLLQLTSNRGACVVCWVGGCRVVGVVWGGRVQVWWYKCGWQASSVCWRGAKCDAERGRVVSQQVDKETGRSAAHQQSRGLFGGGGGGRVVGCQCVLK